MKLIMISVQTTTGGQCMEVLLTAIWPSYKNIPNHIAKDEGITTGGMIAFLLYFLLQLPFLCIPYTKVSSYTLAFPEPGLDLPALGPILLCFQECHCANLLPGHFRRHSAQSWRHHQQQRRHQPGQPARWLGSGLGFLLQ
jgi:hypothetical protein